MDTARIVARDLTDGGGGLAGDGAGRVGGALGYLQLAGDPEDLVDGLVTAAAGCGECHTATGASAPEPPPWTHHDGALRAVWPVVWSRTSEAPPAPAEADVDADAEAMAAVARAWSAADPDADDRAAATLSACQGCHAADEAPPAGSP